MPMTGILLGAGSLLAVQGCKSSLGVKGGRTATAPLPKDMLAEAENLKSLGRDEQAIALLNRAIEQNPELTSAHLDLGDLYLQRGQITFAERRFREAARQKPDNFRAQYGHGLALQLLGRLAESVRAYLRALSINENDFDANLNLATAFLQLDGPAQAKPYALRAIELNPASGPAHANLGAVYSGLASLTGDGGTSTAAQAQHERAVKEYETAAELMDLTPSLLISWAESLGRLGRYREMLNTLKAAVRIEPTAPAYERVGYAFFKLGEYDKAQEAFHRAVQIDARHYPAHNGMGVCLLNEWITGGREDEQIRALAISHLRASLRIYERQPRIVELVSRYGR